jgi:hypothetical protein
VGAAQGKETVSTVSPFRHEVTRSQLNSLTVTANEQTVKTALRLLVWFITGLKPGDE